jgi:hypothetical protein
MTRPRAPVPGAQRVRLCEVGQSGAHGSIYKNVGRHLKVSPSDHKILATRMQRGHTAVLRY